MLLLNEHIVRVLFNEYSGSEKKMTVLLDDDNKYLLKMPDPTREKNSDISYINNAISEYLGCKIFKSIGLPVQEVLLGTYVTEEGKEKICCACKDLREQGEKLIQASTVELSSADSVSTKRITVESIFDFSNRIEGLEQEDILDFYFSQFIVDGLIGNTDRHNGNWGIITDEYNTYVKLAPTFDCGSSLNSLIGDEDITDTSARELALNTCSVLSTEKSHSLLKYSQYILSLENEYVNKALLKIIPNIHLNKIFNIIDEIECISEKRKKFYKDAIQISYDEVLVKAFKKIYLQKLEDLNFQYDKEVDYKEIYKSEMKPLLTIPLYDVQEVCILDTLLSVRRISNKDFVVVDSEDISNNYFRVDSSYKFVDYFCQMISMQKEKSQNKDFDEIEEDKGYCI